MTLRASRGLFRRTRRLVLRPLTARDYARWRDSRLTAPARRNRWDAGPKTERESSPAVFRAWLAARAAERAADRNYVLGVFRRDTGEFIGSASVMNVVRGVTQSAYIGYGLDSRHWGRGFGREAVRGLLDVAFRDLGLHRVEAGVEPGNVRSIRLARSLGLRREGLKRRMVFLRGRWNDLVAYAATCDEFGVRARPARPPAAPIA